MMSKTRGPVPPVILLVFLLMQFALHKWLPIISLVPAPWNYAGIVFIAIGVSIVVLPATAFSRAGTTVIPFHESSTLVTTGLFRVTRNPMYVGMVSALVGVAILLGTLTPFVAPLLFIPTLNARVIRHEEVMLEDIFGDEYIAYKAQVRRWI